MIYLKKYDPRVKVYLSDGSFCEFAPVDRNTGIYATNDPRIERELRDAMANHRGGMEEIALAEYQKLEESKKNYSASPRASREELNLNKGLSSPTSAPQGQPPVPQPKQPTPLAIPVVAAEPNRPKTRGTGAK